MNRAHATSSGRAKRAQAVRRFAAVGLGLAMFSSPATSQIGVGPTVVLAQGPDAPGPKTGSAAGGAVSPADTLLGESLRHYQAGRFKECMETAQQSAKLNPMSSQAFNNIGICAGNLKLWDQAIRSTLEAIRLSPDSLLAKNNLVWIEQQRLTTQGPLQK